MDAINLLEPILQGGIRSVNFFTGRQLSAQDLTQQAQAAQEGDRRLGRAMGNGIAWGLEVSFDRNQRLQPVVTIAKGLAVTRAGQVLELTCPTILSLVEPANPIASTPSRCKDFSPCGAITGGGLIAGAGIYLLALCPATGSEGKAPVNGASGSALCNTQYNVQGVQFRLIALPGFGAAELSDARLRNQLAYQCFGADAEAGFVADPFNAPLDSYGLLDSLRPKLLTDCDVPLAVLYWEAGTGLQFVDLWPVRRRIIAPTEAGWWADMTRDRRRADAEARFLQFQSHLADLIDSGMSLPGTALTDNFALLPPAGLLPTSGSPPTAQVVTSIFPGQTTRGPVFIEAARVQSILRESLDYPPIDLASGVVIWMYQVRENAQQAADRQYILFATGQIPFHGEARFDVSRWNYSNYV